MAPGGFEFVVPSATIQPRRCMGDVLRVSSGHILSEALRSLDQIFDCKAIFSQRRRCITPCFPSRDFGDLPGVIPPPLLEGIARAYRYTPWFYGFYKVRLHTGCRGFAGVLQGFFVGCRGFLWAATSTIFEVLIVLIHDYLKLGRDVEADQIGHPRAGLNGQNLSLFHPRERRANLPRGSVHEACDIGYGGPHFPRRRDVGESQENMVIVRVRNGLLPRPDEGFEAQRTSSDSPPASNTARHAMSGGHANHSLPTSKSVSRL